MNPPENERATVAGGPATKSEVRRNRTLRPGARQETTALRQGVTHNGIRPAPAARAARPASPVPSRDPWQSAEGALLKTGRQLLDLRVGRGEWADAAEVLGLLREVSS